MPGRPKKDPGSPTARYVRKKDPLRKAVNAIQPVELVQDVERTYVSNEPAVMLTELEERVLVESRKGKSAKWIEEHLSFPRCHVRQLIATDRGQAFLSQLSREFAALQASRLAEAALNATNYLDEVVTTTPDFMGDEEFASLDLDKRVELSLSSQSLRVRAASELLKTQVKGVPSVSVNIGTGDRQVRDELLRRLRGESSNIVDVKTETSVSSREEK